MHKALLKRIFTPLLICVPLFAWGTSDNRVPDYSELLAAVKNNQPPSGYINLDQCHLDKNISDMQADKRTYRVKFTDNFSFDPTSGEIVTIMNILYQQTKHLNGTPILMSRPATVILSGKPNTGFLNYQIVMSLQDKTLMQLYRCSWDKAVFLWK